MTSPSLHVLTASLTLCLAGVLLVGCTPESQPKPAPAPSGTKATDSGSSPKQQQVWFDDITARCGIDFVHQTGTVPKDGLYLPEIISGGVALFDYDGDGNLDVYCVQGGRATLPPMEQPKNRLYRNLGGGKFEDVTDAANAGGFGYGIGCAANDFDGDGDLDLYLTNTNENGLLVNQGDGTFELLPDAAGANDPKLSTSAAFFDYDRDGDLDLAVINYLVWSTESEITCSSAAVPIDYCNPLNYQRPDRDRLYRNDGGRFVDVSDSAGISEARGNGLGIVTADFDGDGRMDFFVANDGTENHHWYQTDAGKFEERGLTRGTAVNYAGKKEAGMGVAAVDVDSDGDLDLFLSHLRLESNTLYINNQTFFEDASDRFGLGGSSLPYTGFGLGFADFDLDGDLDLYIANGKVGQTSESVKLTDPYAESNLVYEQRDGRFVAVSPAGAVSPAIERTSRGAAFGDLDNDGDVDVVVMNRDAAPTVLASRAAADPARHWITLDVREKSGGPAMHAQATIKAGSLTLTRTVDPHSSYCSSNDPRLHFGLGSASAPVEVTVRWFDGSEEAFGPLTVKQIHRIDRGRGRAVR